MKKLIMFAMMGLALLLACTGDTPFSEFEATDEEAIFNVVMLDNARLSNLSILPDEIPDTLAFIANPDSAQPLYWHVIDTTTDEFRVTLSDHQVESPIGPVDQGNVIYTKTWLGAFESFRYNAAADSLERYTAEFQMVGTRAAACQRWGVATSQRRGWLLAAMGDARFSAGGSQIFLDKLVFHSESNDDSLFHYGLKNTADIVRFDAGEEAVFDLELSNPANLLYMFIPVGNFGYELAPLVEFQPGEYEVTVTMPSISYVYGQLKFLVVNLGNYPDEYKALGYSYNYRIR